jgi:phosphoglycolate phosphatase
MNQLILFDIDGTLVVTGGAGQRAMNRAFHEVFGVADAFVGIDLAGRTDTSIVADAFARQRMSAEADAVASFRARYLECLREEVPRPGPGKRVLPGIAQLLDALEPNPQTFLGLLTGNGEDAHDRNQLVPVALDRARGRGLPDHVDAGRTVVIGDTPRDIACARAHGARVVAVATGEYPVDALEEADAVFADFSDTQAVLAALGSGAVKARRLS